MFILSSDYWEVRTTEKKGRGIFATKDIEGGTVIGDYIGKVIKPDEEDEIQSGLYSVDISDELCIIADPKQIGVHIINHSCTPNCEIFPYKGHILFFTLRKIFPGEELTLDYYLGNDDEPHNCNHICHCGSPLCRGTWHTSEAQNTKWHEFFAKQIDQDEHVEYKYGDVLQPLQDYPKTVDDNTMYTLFASVDQMPQGNDALKLPGLLELRKQIRETGKKIHFFQLNICVYGFLNGFIVCEPIS